MTQPVSPSIHPKTEQQYRWWGPDGMQLRSNLCRVHDHPPARLRGMGEVYLAQHPRLPRRDALKLLPHDWSADDEYRARFNREADLASTLCWPRQQAHLVAHAGSVGGVPCPLHRHRDEIQAPQSLE